MVRVGSEPRLYRFLLFFLKSEILPSLLFSDPLPHQLKSNPRCQRERSKVIALLKRMVRKTNWGIRILQSNNQSTNEAKTRQNAENQIVKSLDVFPPYHVELQKANSRLPQPGLEPRSIRASSSSSPCRVWSRGRGASARWRCECFLGRPSQVIRSQLGPGSSHRAFYSSRRRSWFACGS